MISGLIDKQDNFEIVRDQIAAILANETASQQALATAADEDPKLWRLRIFSDRANPWEQFQDAVADQSPLVNVWFDNNSFDKSASTPINQKSVGIYNIDCYGYGVSQNIPGGGHIPGDQKAAVVAHRALRLVRNILANGEYWKLDLRGMVWDRWIRSTGIFQPQIGEIAVQNVMGARLVLEVGFSETVATGDESNLLDYVAVDITRTEDGEIVAEADYDYS